jgi:nitroreductase
MKTAVEARKLKRAPAVDGVLPLFLERWSPRAFDEREVSVADLRRIFEAARWAPSSSNEQPWRFVVGLRGSETHKKIVETLAGFNKEWAPKAPVLLVGVASTVFARNGNPNRFALFDLGAASTIVTLQAHALGIATHQMGGFDQDATRRLLEIPEEYAIGSTMALGYHGEPSALASEKLIEGEISPRTRKPLSEIVLAAWGEPAKLE